MHIYFLVLFLLKACYIKRIFFSADANITIKEIHTHIQKAKTVDIKKKQCNSPYWFSGSKSRTFFPSYPWSGWLCSLCRTAFPRIHGSHKRLPIHSVHTERC